MSSHGWPSLEIERDARAQLFVVATVLTVAAIAPFIAWLPIVVASIIAGVATTSAAILFWRIGWLGGGRAVLRAQWTDPHAWRLQTGDMSAVQASIEATLCPDSRVVGRLIWLRFLTAAGPRQLLLWGGALRPDVRRRLIARLGMFALTARTANRAETEAAS